MRGVLNGAKMGTNGVGANDAVIVVERVATPADTDTSLRPLSVGRRAVTTIPSVASQAPATAPNEPIFGSQAAATGRLSSGVVVSIPATVTFAIGSLGGPVVTTSLPIPRVAPILTVMQYAASTETVAAAVGGRPGTQKSRSRNEPGNGETAVPEVLPVKGSSDKNAGRLGTQLLGHPAHPQRAVARGCWSGPAGRGWHRSRRE